MSNFNRREKAIGGGGGGGGCGLTAPLPRRDLLMLPLNFETATGHHSHHHHHLHLHQHHQHHLQHHHHLPTEAQAGLAMAEENFATFHRFLASLLGASEAAAAAAAAASAATEDAVNGSSSSSSSSSSGCELRVALGKQCAECNAVCLLLRHTPADAGGTGIDGCSALSVLLLHLLTLMLLLGEPLPQAQQAELLALWEQRLQPELLAQMPTVAEARKSYARLMGSATT